MVPSWVFSLKDLMFEVTDLLNETLKQRFGEVRPTILSYKHAFMDRLDLNPLQATLQDLKDCCRRVGLSLDLGEDRFRLYRFIVLALCLSRAQVLMRQCS